MAKLTARPRRKPKSRLDRYAKRTYRKPSKSSYTIRFSPKSHSSIFEFRHRSSSRSPSQSRSRASHRIPSSPRIPLPGPHTTKLQDWFYDVAEANRNPSLSIIIPLSQPEELSDEAEWYLGADGVLLDLFQDGPFNQVETFVDQVQMFISRSKSVDSDTDQTALFRYLKDSKEIMERAIHEVVIKSQIGLQSESINQEEGFQTWSNSMLALFEMIDKALYCRIRELKCLVAEKGEVVEGIVDGMLVSAPGLLQFDVTEPRIDVVKEMLGEAKGIHRYLIDFRRARDRLKEVIDQWYEGKTWINSRDDSGGDTDTDETASNDVLEDEVISQEDAHCHSQGPADLPSSIADSEVSSLPADVSQMDNFVEVLDAALLQHLETEEPSLDVNSDIDAMLSDPAVTDLSLVLAEEVIGIDQALEREADIIWVEEEHQVRVDIRHHECSAENDDLIEEVKFHEWLVWDEGEERDFIDDIYYHERELPTWEAGMELQRDLELESMLFWDSDEGRDLQSDLDLEDMLLWDSEEGRQLQADIDLEIYVAEDLAYREGEAFALEHQREFDLERWVAEEAAYWAEGAEQERMRDMESS